MLPSLWDRLRDWLLLLLLLSISIGVLVQFNQSAVRGLRATALEVTARIEQRMSWAGNYLRALEENNELRANNIQLSSELARLSDAERENQRLRALIGLRQTQQYPFLAASIIGKDIGRLQKSHFMLDRGASDGIQRDMAVMDERGVLGKVTLVSENYAQAMSYLNTDFRISARVQRLGVDGIVRWDGVNRNRLIMEFVPKTEDVRPGDIIRSREGLIFPEGFAIGIVDSVWVPQGRGELLIQLTPSASIHDAEHAFVLLHAPDPERLNLRTRTDTL